MTSKNLLGIIGVVLILIAYQIYKLIEDWLSNRK